MAACGRGGDSGGGGDSTSTGKSAPQAVKNAEVIDLQSMQGAKKALRTF